VRSKFPGRAEALTVFRSIENSSFQRPTRHRGRGGRAGGAFAFLSSTVGCCGGKVGVRLRVSDMISSCNSFPLGPLDRWVAISLKRRRRCGKAVNDKHTTKMGHSTCSQGGIECVPFPRVHLHDVGLAIMDNYATAEAREHFVRSGSSGSRHGNAERSTWEHWHRDSRCGVLAVLDIWLENKREDVESGRGRGLPQSGHKMDEMAPACQIAKMSGREKRNQGSIKGPPVANGPRSTGAG